jgi:alkylated DNA repair dioxygenase AlkB
MTFERIELTNDSWLDIGIYTRGVDFEGIWDIHPKECSKIILYGKEMVTPRWNQSYIKPYIFSGMSHDGKKLPGILKTYLDWVNTLGYAEFNQVFLNWYKNGNHYIGPHSDDEKQLVPESPIVSISFGEERKFRIRDKKDKKVITDIILCDKQIVVMCGKFQKELTHEIVKVSGKKGENMKRRINITFRQFK